MNSLEEDLIGRQPCRKRTSKEHNVKGRWNHRNTTSQEDDLTNLKEDKMGQLVLLDLSLAHLSPSLSFPPQGLMLL